MKDKGTITISDWQMCDKCGEQFPPDGSAATPMVLVVKGNKVVNARCLSCAHEAIDKALVDIGQLKESLKALWIGSN